MMIRLYAAALLGCLAVSSAIAQTTEWDDGATDNPPPGDGLHWNDKKNWENDSLPNGVVGAVLDTTVVRVQDGLLGIAATLSAGSTTLDIDGTLIINGAFDVDGDVTIASASDTPNSGAALRIGGGTTLEGDGEIRLQRSSAPGVNPAVFSSVGVDPVTLNAERTIRGEGTIDAVLNNQGMIIAEDVDDQPAAELVLRGEWQNSSIVRTTASAGISVQGTFEQTISGQLIADANVIKLQLGSITGGTLVSQNNGEFRLSVDGNIGNLVNEAPFNVTTGSSQVDLNIIGGITNNNVIVINSEHTQGSVAINFSGNAILDGTGSIVLGRQNLGLSNSLGAKLTTAVGATVTQEANHTIRGEGQLQAALVNHGVVEAVDVTGDGLGVLLVTNNVNGSAHAANHGVFRALAGGTVDLIGRLDQSATGRLIAADQGIVQLRSGTVVGGTLETEGSGVVTLATGSTLVDVSNLGAINIPGGGSAARLELGGAFFHNDGVITVNSTEAFSARLQAISTLQLAGTGEIVLNRTLGGATFLLAEDVHVTQAAGHTIRGRGQILGNDATLINNGTLAGASDTELLDVNPQLMGDGLLRNVFVDGVHSPGNPNASLPTAIVPLEGHYNFGNGPGINSDNRLVIELGGLTPGLEHDQLTSSDANNLVTIRNFATSLDVRMIDIGNGYVPAVGDRFTILSSTNDIVGMFAKVELPSHGAGRALAWTPIDRTDPTKMVLEIAAVDFLEADFDQDFDVDSDDLTGAPDGWQSRFGHDLSGPLFLTWQRQLGLGVSAVAGANPTPEPATLLILAQALLVIRLRLSRISCRSRLPGQQA